MVKKLVISGGIILCFAVIILFLIPFYSISQDVFQQSITESLKKQFRSIHQIGSISFSWPNRFTISSVSFRRQDQNKEPQLSMKDIRGSLKFFPILRKKFVVKNVSIREMNYENCLLVENLVTDTFSYKDGIVFTHSRLRVNDGPATLSGMIDFLGEKPVFDIQMNAKDIHITQDIPILQFLPIFRVDDDGELGGMLSFEGSIRGNGLDKTSFYEKLSADLHFTLRDGYIQGNRLFASLAKIFEIKNMYSFDLIDTTIQIKDASFFIPEMNMQSPIMEITASGSSAFDGNISYDAQITVNRNYLNKSKKEFSLLFPGHSTVPLEIRGTAKNPTVAVKFSQDNLTTLIKGLENGFFSNSQKK
ncbi:MAG: AsmA-like C-terminal region-containing protein [Candidatus Brocadiaceae bacterium]|nr:AsmA-like C-terminal region-containing protein [Candidatus Brocadiaceae bacterium]